jgi:subtilisin-like proprotein convertase family protein
MQTYRVAVQLHSFLISALNGSGQRQDQAALPLLKEPPMSTQYEVGWAPEGVWTFWIRDQTSPKAGHYNHYPVTISKGTTTAKGRVNTGARHEGIQGN